MNSNMPNIILINCDDLGYADLGCYGSEINNTPIIDKMAKEGMKCSDFYMASPVCSPSRGAMMTGCYPKRIGFDNFDGRLVLRPGQKVGLNPNEMTIAKVLKEAGYNTMIIGKWHCGDQHEFLPTRHGFDRYYGLPYSNDMGRSNRFKDFPPLPLMIDEDVIEEQPDQASLTERYVEKAVSFIRDNKEKSFFLYFAHMYVHLPLFVPECFLNQSKNGRYGAAVESIDWATGVILNELKKQGISNNTLVIFTSDNGSRGREGGSNEPLRGGKGSTWEGGMRVPCVMYWPDRIDQGSICNEIVTSMDFLPTFAHLAGIEIPNDRIIDGIDIWSRIFNKEFNESSKRVFFYYRGNNLEAVRQGKWKLHVWKFDKLINELYDLDNDLGETKNLYDQYPKTVEKMKEHLQKCREDIGDDLKGIKGNNVRPIGRVKNSDTLTHYDEDHPYMIAMYDLEH